MNSRVVLMAGFGGLLLLMAFAEFDIVRALQSIQASNDRIREDFLRRTRVLERIRTDLYVSGTYLRDYLLEPEAGKAEGHRYSLLETRADMDSALGEYRALLTPAEAPTFQKLSAELADYWRALEPALRWTAAERKAGGYVFVRDQVFPRRAAMLQIADRIGAIDESQLDAGRLKVVETFSQYRGRLTLTIGLTIGLGLLLASFIMRKILRLETEAAAHRAELQQLSARLVAAQENERTTISRELHDEIGQSLTGVLVEMANLSTIIRGGDKAQLAPKAEEIKKLVENSLGVVRNLALLLRPSMLDDLGLIPALEWQAREISRRNGIRVKVAADDVSEDLPDEHKTCVYRVTQEALHNTVRHAEARNVTVSVRQEGARLSVVVQDDGKGFNPRLERGLGLIGIEERVANLGGAFDVHSEAGKGATLRVSLPLPENKP